MPKKIIVNTNHVLKEEAKGDSPKFCDDITLKNFELSLLKSLHGSLHELPTCLKRISTS